MIPDEINAYDGKTGMRIPKEMLEREGVTNDMIYPGQGVIQMKTPDGRVGTFTFFAGTKESFLEIMNTLSKMIYDQEHKETL